MQIRTLAQLQAVDERVRVFSGLLPPNAELKDKDVVRRRQEEIAGSDLVSDVPEDIQSSFERLRTMHTHGVFAYDLYSVVDQTHAFVLEQALGERFIEFYGGVIPFMDKDMSAFPLKARNFREVFLALSPRGSHRKARLLAIRGSSETWPFHASLKGLHRWAIRAGLLRGQQNRFREDRMRDLRNMAAHPRGHTLTGPPESAHSIRVLAEIINHLWGATTANGSRYAPPLQREILILGRSAGGGSRSLGYPASMTEAQLEPGWEYFIVRGQRWDESLMEAAPPFKHTNLPTDFLWGPGPARDALDWVDKVQPQSDTVDHLDRLFLVRGTADEWPEPVELDPNSLELERGAAVIRADFPLHALGHVRALLESDTKHSPKGFCNECPVETVRPPDG